MSEVVTVQGEKTKGIAGSTVKIIAIITMLIDHIGAVVVERYMDSCGINEVIYSQDITEWFGEYGLIYLLYVVMRCIGRMGFPLFIFLLVEGFKYTHSRLQYAIRLGVFAVISEIPFNLALSNSIFSFEYQSVFVTLLLGFLFMCWDDFVQKKQIAKKSGIAAIVFSSLGFALWLTLQLTGGGIPERNSMKIVALGALLMFTVLSVFLQVKFSEKKGPEAALRTGVSLLGLAALMFAADLLNTDYGGMGVLAIAVAYAFRRDKNLSIAMCCLSLTVFNFVEIFAFADLIVVLLYNGKKGMKLKYVFYAFYPVHLFLLHLLSHALGFVQGNWWGF